MDESQKISFIKNLLISLKDFEKYSLFIEEKLKKSIKYVVQLSLILGIIVAITFSIKYGILIYNAINYIKDDLPEFKYEEGKLKFNIENPIILGNYENNRNESYKIIIDTKEKNEEVINDYKKQIGLYNYGILFLEDRIAVDTSIFQDLREISYSEIQENLNISNSFTKEDIINYINNNKASIYLIAIEGFAIMYLFLFGNYFLTIILDAILLGVLGYIISKIVKMKIRYSQAYAMALHALTLPAILNVIYVVINVLTGFYIKYFNFMYTTISYIYIIAAILSIRQNIIKQEILIEDSKSVESSLNNDEIETNQEVKEDKNIEEKEKNNIGDSIEEN